MQRRRRRGLSKFASWDRFGLVLASIWRMSVNSPLAAYRRLRVSTLRSANGKFFGGVNLIGAESPCAREAGAPPADRPARAGWAALRQFLFREFFLEIFPAALVSRATRNQTDPLAPLGRRCGCWPPSPFLEFGLGAGAAAAAPDSMVWSAAPVERSEVRGLRQQPARNRTDTGPALALARANRRY